MSVYGQERYFCSGLQHKLGDWGLGIGDWGLGTGDWGLGTKK